MSDLVQRLREGGCGTYCDQLEAEAADELERLMGICTALHDRILRGDSDRELMDLAEQAWKPAQTTTNRETK